MASVEWDEAAITDRALPFVEHFFRRRGLPYRSQELGSLIGYVLSAAQVELKQGIHGAD